MRASKESRARVVFIARRNSPRPSKNFPREGKWVTELKFDGYRILAYVDGERVRCFSRSGLDWTHRMPAVAAALARLRSAGRVARRRIDCRR